MLRIVLSMILMCQILLACTKESSAVETKDVAVAEGEQRMSRRKIERLDIKTFIELTIDLMREEAKWYEEWARYMQDKRTEYYASFGLTEKQFTDFSEKNAMELQRFLRDNPHYSQEYTEASIRYARENP